MTPDAIAFMQGDTSPEVLAEVRAAMLRWTEQTGDRPLGMHRFFGIGGPRAARIELRLNHLLAAADVLPGPSHWARCQQLAEAARAFRTRRWQRWKDLDAPPPEARPVDAHLWHARRVGEELPETPEAYCGIVPKQDTHAA